MFDIFMKTITNTLLSDRLDRMDKLMKDYNEEKNELIKIFKRFAGPEAWSVIQKNKNNNSSDCDVSSLTEQSSSNEKGKPKSSESFSSNSRNEIARIPNILETGEYNKKNYQSY